MNMIDSQHLWAGVVDTGKLRVTDGRALYEQEVA
jgi:hypothetical protein